MFLAHRMGQPARAVETVADAADATWLDLIDPTPQEQELAAKVTSAFIPHRSDLEEIESSSRLYTRDGIIYVSTPLVRRTSSELDSTPVGFVLTPHQLVTIRFMEYMSFESAGRQIASATTPMSASNVMVLLMECIIDRLADVLEHVGQDLNQLSRDVFAGYGPHTGRIATWQRAILRRVGHAEDFCSLVRDSLLGLGRIVIFTTETAKQTLPHSLALRMATVNRDIASLNDFVMQLSNKVQFLLDAALGFISIEQNDGMKILTVVSFIGVAPTLIAGIYGMNFKDIPELNWSFGYWYSLAAMALSVLLPLLWFWKRGWLGGAK